MALSNIFKEPRREITETLIGIAVIGGLGGALVWGDYALAVAVLRPGPSLDGSTSYGERIAMAMVFYPIAMLVALIAAGLCLAVVHAAGENICNRLQTHGVHLRPRRRH